MNQKQLLFLAEKILKQNKIEDSYIKAKILLQHILKQNKQELVIHSLEEVDISKQIEFEKKIQMLTSGIPVQYITNHQEFMGLNFYVDENVLIPQPDTEILVQTTIELIKKCYNKNNIFVLDLCTGSGNIGISIAKYIENVNIVSTDISNQAIKIAMKNAKKNKVDKKIKFINSNLFEKIEQNKFDYIVSNPPYIKTNIISKLSLEVQKEPYIALNGGKDGLEFYKKILEQSPNYLKSNGYLLLEIGYNQGMEIISLWEKNTQSKFNLVTTIPIKDYNGNDRVIIFQKK